MFDSGSSQFLFSSGLSSTSRHCATLSHSHSTLPFFSGILPLPAEDHLHPLQSSSHFIYTNPSNFLFHSSHFLHLSFPHFLPSSLFKVQRCDFCQFNLTLVIFWAVVNSFKDFILQQSLCIFLTRRIKLKFFASKCQDLVLNHSTWLNTKILFLIWKM